MRGDLRAETVTVTGARGDPIEAYLAQPLDDEARGGVVVVHHMPGYDEGSKEITRTFAANGYDAVCPNLYSRDAPGMSVEDAAARVRASGGVTNERLVGDVAGAAAYLRSLPSSNGKVGVIGYCSGGRHALLAACNVDLDAAIDCYGAFVTNPPPEQLGLSNVGPIVDQLKNLRCPLLGLFGAEDQFPSPADTAELEKHLTSNAKTYEFHTYENAGHAFFATERTAYRPEAANEGWKEVLSFFGRYLAN
jgi:carboxymethylenebutenolidase